jgi:hypothetical protein
MSSSASSETKVYVTRTGGKYHRISCGYLRSSYEMKLGDATKRYDPCSRCCPPILDYDSSDSVSTTENTRIDSFNSSPTNHSSAFGLFSRTSSMYSNGLGNSRLSTLNFLNAPSQQNINPFLQNNNSPQRENEISKLEEKLTKLFEKKLDESKLHFENKLNEMERNHQLEVKNLHEQISENNILISNLTEKVQHLEEEIAEERNIKLNEINEIKNKSEENEKALNKNKDKTFSMESQVKLMMGGYSKVEKLLLSVDKILNHVDSKFNSTKAVTYSNGRIMKTLLDTPAGTKNGENMENQKIEKLSRKSSNFQCPHKENKNKMFGNTLNFNKNFMNFDNTFKYIEQELTFTKEIKRKDF